MLCNMCNGKLKVTVTGMEFFVREDCVPGEIQFDPLTNIDGTPKEMDEMLAVTVECCNDPSHALFGPSPSAIKAEVFFRIMLAAKQYMQKYIQPTH